MRNLQYLWYIIKHKYWVGYYCIKLYGLWWRAITHDLSKLNPKEFFPYRDRFYPKDGKGDIRKGRDETGYYNPTKTNTFKPAWLHHIHNNSHHWQFYVMPEDDGGTSYVEIPGEDLQEMICDWLGAGRAQGFTSPDRHVKWYEANKDKLFMTVKSRALLEALLKETPRV